MAVLAGAKNPTGQTVLLKKVFLRELNLLIFSRSLPSGLISLLSNAVVVCHPLSSFPLVVRHPILHAVVVHHLCCPPLSSSTVTIVVVCCRLLPLLSLPLRVSAVSRCLLLSFPFVLCRPISHAIVVHCCRCPPLPSSSAAAILCCHSHHHHSAVSVVFLTALVLPHCSLPPNHTCRHRPPPLSSATNVVYRRHCTYTRPPY